MAWKRSRRGDEEATRSECRKIDGNMPEHRKQRWSNQMSDTVEK
jgi:hypothetical protein